MSQYCSATLIICTRHNLNLSKMLPARLYLRNIYLPRTYPIVAITRFKNTDQDLQDITLPVKFDMNTVIDSCQDK